MMKIQNKFIIFVVLILSIFLISQFIDFTITGYVTTETVESANDVGIYSSIALDSNDKVHVSSYSDKGSSSDLRYCNNTAGSWSCTDADSFSNGYSTSIAIDSSDKIHISYYTLNNLKYCNNTAGSWSCATIETGNDVGNFSSIAIDLNDSIHISHYNATGQDLRYCNNTAGSWSCISMDTTNDVGKYSSIAIDSNNKVHISSNLIDGVSVHYLRYCNNTAGSWSCISMDTTGGIGLAGGEYTSIAMDSNNKVHISHARDNLGFTALRYCNNTQGSWSCADVETTNDVGQYSSIAIDSNDKIHISHYDADNDDLRYCNNINGTFVCKKLADVDANSLGTPNGRALALKKGRIVDSTSFSGKVHISWYNNTDLMYTSVDPFEPTASAVCSPGIVTLGDAFPCSCSGSDSSSGGVTISSSSTSGSITDTSKTGTFTYTCTVTDGGENSVSATATYTVDYPPSGGGGISTPKEGEPTLQKSHLIVQINPGEEITMTSFSGIGVKEIVIEVNQELQNVRIKVLKYDSKPVEVSKDISGKVYRYLEISTENLNESNLEKVIVKFEVEKFWLSDNSLNKEDISVFKFDNSSEKWNSLQTSFDSEDDNFYIYSVELDSFSFFAIGEKVKEEIGEVGEKPLTEKGFFESIREKVPTGLWWSLVFVLVVGILLVVYFIRKKREEEINNSQNPIGEEVLQKL